MPTEPNSNTHFQNLELHSCQLCAAWEQSRSLMALLDTAGRVLYCNPACWATMHYAEGIDDRLPLWSCLFSGEEQQASGDLSSAVGRAARGEYSSFDIVRQPVPLRITVEPLRDEQGAIGLLLMHAHDISEHLMSRQSLEQLAHYDPLTLLPNRNLFADRLRLALARARREGGLVAICYLDLDGFKVVNDRFGHDAGDRLLVEIASRLRESVRGGDTVARLGGDEFILIIGSIKAPEELDAAMQRILAATREPVLVDGHVAIVSASIGIAQFPTDGEDADRLIRLADQAMYVAKQSGKHCYRFHNTRSDALVKSHYDLMQSLEHALRSDEFELLYQPKVSLRTGKVMGVEALLRWRHPVRGLLAPADFLDVLEASDLAVAVGVWVLEAVLRQAEGWYKNGLSLAVGINVSPHHFHHPDFVRDLGSALGKVPALSRSQLELEIGESAAMFDKDYTARVMQACEALGVRFAIDDFGSAGWHHERVGQLPARTLKIDRRIIANLLQHSADLELINGIMTLANVYRQDVVAKGIESPQHAAMLLKLGCDIAQGYGIAPPMRAADLPQWIQSLNDHRPWMAGATVVSALSATH